MYTVYLLVVTVVSSALWIPVAWKFFRSWHHRRSPESLAISSMVLYHVYLLNANLWSAAERVSRTWVDNTTVLFSLLVVLHFYLSFRWSKQRFKDEDPRSNR